ncbi:hypothetical protein LTS18_002037, partial [Coniosporium uncinatum]
METNSALLRHQFTPLTKIQRLAGRSGEALFDTIFAYQKTALDTNSSHPWKKFDEHSTADYTVSIELEPAENDALQICLTFATDVLPREQATVMLEQLDHLLVNLVTTPDGSAADVPPSNPDLMAILPPKHASLPSEVSLLHEFVELGADQYPDRIAFEFATDIHNGKVDSQKWTYSELNAEGNRVADLIHRSAPTTGRNIAVCFDKCPEASFAMLGILKAGRAFVALDPKAPSDRKKFILEDSGASLLLTTNRYSEDLKGQVDTPMISLDEYDLSQYFTSPIALDRA